MTHTPAHVWHQLNGLQLDLQQDGTLDISTEGPGATGSLTLGPRAAVALMMFFQFPNVAPLLTAAEARQQAALEADLYTDLATPAPHPSPLVQLAVEIDRIVDRTMPSPVEPAPAAT